MTHPTNEISGRCYCGHVKVAVDEAPWTVAYCHCSDCRRVTGAPVTAFAAFNENAVSYIPEVEPKSSVPGVDRWFCRECGSPLGARFDYLPGQIYVPIGILDQAAELAPSIHCHIDAALPWLHIQDGAERVEGTARDSLPSVDS